MVAVGTISFDFFDLCYHLISNITLTEVSICVGFFLFGLVLFLSQRKEKRTCIGGYILTVFTRETPHSSTSGEVQWSNYCHTAHTNVK